MDKGKGLSSTSRNDEEQPLSNEMANGEVDHHGEKHVEVRNSLLKLSQDFENAANQVEEVVRTDRYKHALVKDKLSFIYATAAGVLHDELNSLRDYLPHEYWPENYFPPGYSDAHKDLRLALADYEAIMPIHIDYEKRIKDLEKVDKTMPNTMYPPQLLDLLLLSLVAITMLVAPAAGMNAAIELAMEAGEGSGSHAPHKIVTGTSTGRAGVSSLYPQLVKLSGEELQSMIEGQERHLKRLTKLEEQYDDAIRTGDPDAYDCALKKLHALKIKEGSGSALMVKEELAMLQKVRQDRQEVWEQRQAKKRAKAAKNQMEILKTILEESEDGDEMAESMTAQARTTWKARRRSRKGARKRAENELKQSEYRAGRRRR
ncbi:hypothetical protein FA10DRAFT_288497 [Acaromyces ingoldii]|uniref:Uncharacterized protein n=1 Tax=Acaromyces ingoldii TaxID=215250 RepID=A0A316YI40_9BASI|nr:hypothetical protein FA10DRAFT_288497 [Acaromyces ingoldii]PWN87783.1 hypothetical protein FA10DRAFT_288497 [Acaromyces ingoldii]